MFPPAGTLYGKIMARMRREATMTGKKMLAPVLAGLLFFSLAPQVAAQLKVFDFSGPTPPEVYQGLPGVVTPEAAEARKKSVSCVRIPTERPIGGGRWRPGDDVVYACTDGNTTVQTNRLPPSRERDMRGIGW